jgi:CBS-domain-containing membrane protein
MVWVRELIIPTERPPLVSEVIAKFADRGCHMVSVTDPYGRILGFLDRSHYFSIK